MTAKLTSRERLLRAIRREEVDFLPCSPRLFTWMVGVYGSETWVAQMRAKREFGHDPLIEVHWTELMPNSFFRVPDLSADLPEISVEVKTARSGGKTEATRIFHTPAGDLKEVRILGDPGKVYGDCPDPGYKEHFIKERADLEKVKYILPPVERRYYDQLPTIIDLVGDEGLVEVCAFEGAGGYLLSDLVGPEAAFYMAADDEELFGDCMQLFNDCYQTFMKQALEAGAPVVRDTWWTMSLGSGWGPGHWQKYALPLVRSNVALAHSYGTAVHFYDDGKMSAILPMVVDAGVDVIETLSPPPLGDIDLAEVKRQYGDRVCLKGNIDQVNTICRGTKEQVREAVRCAIDATGGGTGHILSTADSIRPESPIENIRAYFNAWRDFRR